VEGPALGKHVATLPQEVEILQLVPVEVSGHVDLLSAHDHDLVASEDELGYDGGQPAQHVTPAIDDNGLRRKARHF